MEHLQNCVDGRLVAPVAGRYIENFDPSTGRCYSMVPDSDESDLERAIAAAEAAFPPWSATPVEERARLLDDIAIRIEAKLDELARAETVDNGKPLSLARAVDIPRASSNFRFFAHASTQFASESHNMGARAINYTLRDPVGVVACISPWNLPLYLFSWKIAPALAVGNCVVAKPSEVTPMTAYLLAKIGIDAGLPPGVLNVLQGRGPKIGAALTAHPKVKAISFTGGTRTGAEIARIAAPQFKKLSLEMGGKNPTVVFADCDYPRALDTVLRSAFTNQGQICLSGSRILIERPLYQRLRDDLVNRTKTLKVGDPLDDDTQQGAVVSANHRDKILSYIQIAREEGGTILTGGDSVLVPGRCKDGYFVEPTVIEGLAQTCRTNQEEIFGPVVTLQAFDSEDQALELANATDYGLAASIWSQDVRRCHRVAQRLESGVVWINTWLLRDLRTPFGGMKNSGVGREGGLEALRFFTEPKNVCIDLAD